MTSAHRELPEAEQVRNGGEVTFRDPPWIQELDAMESGFGNKSKDAAIFMKLVMVRRKTGLPDEELQEMLRGKLRILENDSGEVMALFSELSARLLSIHSEEDLIVVTFKTFEEIWKFNTYYSLGLLGHCMENLLLDQVFWLHHLDEEDLGIEVLIHEETLHLMYKGILMQEESFFAVCTAEQNCESTSTGSELRLQEGNVAIFEPPTDGSEWTVQLLVDGSRGSIAKPALEPVSPFHQWFLKACPENILMGNAKMLCEFPYQFAVGSCIATVGYEGSGPDELSFKSGDCVEIVGFLVSCFEWFVGTHTKTGRTGLVKTSLVKPTNSICESAEVFLNEEEESLFKWKEEFFEEKSIDVLKKMCQTDVDAVYKLDKLDTQDPPGIPRQTSTFNNERDPQRQELQNKIAVCLSRLKEPHVPPLEETQDEDRQSEHHHNASLSSKEHSEPCFIINSEGDSHSADDFQTLLAFLNCSEYKEEFRNIYDFSFRFLQSMFQGYTDDEELVFYLGMARENARKKKFLWAQTRICFLLGKLCARRLKFSQARVYFEEALSIAREQFKDIFLLISIYTNLAAIYLKQKNKEKYVAIFERIAAFLMGIPNYICSTEQESEILKYVLKKAVLAQNKVAEVRTCFLLAKLYTKLNQPQSALLFTERLQILAKELSLTSKVMPSDYYLTLGKLYAKGLAELSLVRAVELFSQLEDVAHEENFITVLLELGQYYVSQTQLEKGMICYEWAFLMAIKANHVECQLQATKQLCHFYHMICPNEAQCIIYNEYMLTLVRKAGNKEWEGEILETISQLYFSLGTERAYKSALDYTKRSLGIFIDLRKKEKEAYAWLQAGKIYHILRQNELVDLYIQVAQDCCLSTADMHFILELLEAAGDVFFNSSQDREKALTFYRDKALPIALKTGNVKTQLRLSNKLAELLLQLKLYGEAVDHAQAALAISISLGERLNERVAFHRLATLYHCLGQYEMAEHYYLKALSLCPSPLEFDEETMYYVKVYQLLGDMIFYDLKDPFDAAGYYHLALAAAMDLGNKKSQLKLCTRLATIYHNFLVNRELSLFFYQKARVFAADLNVRRINLSPDQYYQSVSQYKTFV
ncbi:S3TC1 protein, partial [Atractosteus spatula]|nr:S3TC1 protein [Atractosteus spatula]